MKVTGSFGNLPKLTGNLSDVEKKGQPNSQGSPLPHSEHLNSELPLEWSLAELSPNFFRSSSDSAFLFTPAVFSCSAGMALTPPARNVLGQMPALSMVLMLIPAFIRSMSSWMELLITRVTTVLTSIPISISFSWLASNKPDLHWDHSSIERIGIRKGGRILCLYYVNLVLKKCFEESHRRKYL